MHAIFLPSPVIVAVLCAAASVSSEALGQAQGEITASPSVGGLGSAMVSRRNVELWSDALGLSPDQRGAVQSLHAGYSATRKAAQAKLAEDLRRASLAFQESQSGLAFARESAAARARFLEMSIQSEAALLADIKALLTPEQAPSWPKVERMHRREQAARVSVVSGDSLDLMEILLDLKVPVQGVLAEALDEYELELDRAIQTRLSVSKDAPVPEPGQPLDISQARKNMASNHASALRLKEINQRHARRLRSLLPDEAHTAFSEAVRQRTYPRVYEQSTASRSLAHALELTDLDSEQRSRLSLLHARYAQELTAANASWAAAIERVETDPAKGAFASGLAGSLTIILGEEDHELAEARTRRMKLDQSTMEQLRSILAPAQLDAIPQTPSK